MLAQIMRARPRCEEDLQAPYVSRRLMALVRDNDRQRTPEVPVPAKDEFVDQEDLDTVIDGISRQGGGLAEFLDRRPIGIGIDGDKDCYHGAEACEVSEGHPYDRSTVAALEASVNIFRFLSETV